MGMGKILVAEDNVSMLQLLGMSLKSGGYEVDLVENGIEALDHLNQSEFDLVITDVNMPKLSGFELCRQIRADERYSTLPVIFVSCRTSLRDKVTGFDLGADDYIGKPFDVEELLARVKAKMTRYNLTQKESSTDFLTGLLNRRGLEKKLSCEIDRSQRFKKTFSLAMIDIDHFKKVNDTYGHAVGDEVLKYVADGLSDKLRSIDTLSRFGGEEFVIIMPETALDGATPALERMRKKFVTGNFLGDDDISLNVTVSIGLAQYPSHGDTSAKLIESADAALYSAKRAGRNKLQKFSL